MSITKNYNACIYARLSRDDGDKLESYSITNQKALIRDFLSKHPEIHVVSEKTDDGYSGVNFDRPAFQEMMDEIRSGKVNCVVVKDLSRFGRNYIEAGNYIERVFPFMGVRFIAINDSYDSLDKNQSDSLIIPFKNLINDAYCKDISVKIRSQLEIKRKKGQFIGAFAVYGYLKDEEDHNKLVVDTFASEVVRAIFKWKLEGMSQGRIADKLNMQGVLCPMEYKLSLGMKVQTNFKVHKQAMWSPVSVTRILTNEIYTGVLVQGKSGTPNYKVKKVMPKEEADWIRVENSHEAIVCREDFENIQGILKRDIRSAPDEESVYPLSGYVKCAYCRQNMVRKRYVIGDKEYAYFVCSTHKANKGCSTHSIKEAILMDAVLMGAQSQIGMVLELERMVEILDSLPESQQNVFNYDAQIVKLKEEIERNKNFKLKLYENLQEGMIGQEEYFLFKKSYADKIQAAETAIAAIETERSQTVSQNRERLAWIGVYKKYQNVTEITRRMVVDLIDQIVIQEGNGVNITWRYWDDYSRIIDSFANISDEVKIQLMA
jgi:DNA invertase Pin-like site-specific DNA recombinase